MNQCHLCGCSVSQAENTCPACFTSLQPLDMTWAEFKQRLINAGWKPHEADEEIQRIQEENESGE